MLQLLYHSLMSDDKAVNSAIFNKFFNNLKKHIILLIYCLVKQRMYQSQVHAVEELLDIWHMCPTTECS